ncbi:MAG TPA: DUF5916 domain-containing protein [Chitinophagaceae bacterium]|nr:DUF5916 domain-containing protein [Chitinophagaceae bacterium]
MSPLTLTAVLFSCITVCAVAQPKKLTAVKVQQAPKLDGKLDDAAWQAVPAASDFIINSPDFGKPSACKSIVKVVYTDDAIYVGAYMYDNPVNIRRQLTQRDNEKFQDADNFGVAFDTYSDKQNAFQFIVTSANVQSDVRVSATYNPVDDGLSTTNSFTAPGFDYTWDAVWDSRTAIVADGWIAELKIPFSALRFAKKDVQDWGVNFSRFIRRVNEQSYWNTVDPKASGFVNQFGSLQGLQNLQPPLRLSFLPYVSTGYQDVPTSSGTIRNFLNSGGMDVKWGINESFTMDMTLIPDFGQVQSDNVILNLSPFEQQYAENRPFFTEGTEMFNKAGIFYSRRVGGIPGKYGDILQLAGDSGYTIRKNPSVTQLYNATKFSGRTKGNLGIGIFNAVTAPMYAEYEKPGGDVIRTQTEPLANYNIIVLDQALKNRSYITFTNTSVLRSGGSRNANVSALDFSVYDKKNTYNFQAKARYSSISGDSAYSGYKLYTSFDKVSGKWQWGVFGNIESEKYDPNDLGILRAPNDVVYGLHGSFQQYEPDKLFYIRNYSVSIQSSNLYAPYTMGETHISASFLHVFKNFWDASLLVESSPFWFNDFYELRIPGRIMKRTPWAFIGIRGSTDSRKKLYVSYFYGYANFSPIPNDPFYVISNGVRYRFSPKFSIDINGESQHDMGNFGAVLDASGNPVISNDSSVIGIRQYTQFTTVVNGIYNFKARMNLSVRLRHYWSKVRYTAMYDVKTDGYWVDRALLPGHDENFNTFNLDMFFTWDFRLGSRLVVGWKNALGPDASVDGIKYTKYLGNLTHVFGVPHSNEFTIKFIYYIDYNDLHKKKE